VVVLENSDSSQLLSLLRVLRQDVVGLELLQVLSGLHFLEPLQLLLFEPQISLQPFFFIACLVEDEVLHFIEFFSRLEVHFEVVGLATRRFLVQGERQRVVAFSSL